MNEIQQLTAEIAALKKQVQIIALCNQIEYGIDPLRIKLNSAIRKGENANAMRIVGEMAIQSAKAEQMATELLKMDSEGFILLGETVS